MAMSSVEIPVIDFRRAQAGGLSPGTCEWNELAKQTVRACETHGFFRVMYDHNPDDILALGKEIFELPLETKKMNKREKPFSGYSANIPILPLYESTGIEGGSESIEPFVDLMWPQGHPEATKTLKSMYEEIGKLEFLIGKLIIDGLGIGNQYESLVKTSHGHCTFIKYVPPLPNEPDIGLRPHTDKGFFTMIFQDETGGLEFQCKDGSWIPASPIPNSFVVLLGDSFKAWSNDRLQNGMHRVLINNGKERYSFLYFVIPNDEDPVTTPEALVDSDHPRVFRQYDYVDYLQYAVNAVMANETAGLYAYAGI